MAFIQTEFYSEALSGRTSFNMFIPNDISKFVPGIKETNVNYQRNMKTLYLLHGYTGSNNDWIFGSSVHEYALRYNMAVIMPSVGNSFYLDGKGTGKAFCQYVGRELVEYAVNTFGLSDRKEDTFIGGLSMGGFGALHTGLKYPDTFGKIIALSSALIVHHIENKKEDFKNNFADYYYYTSVFGDLDKLGTSENNPEFQIRRLKEQGKDIPKIYMACGTEDFLLEDNRVFHDFLKSESIDVQYMESPGVHDWKFWNEYLEPSIQWLLA